MAGPVLTLASPAQCAHGGTATPTQPNLRVLAVGAATLTIDGPWIVIGCPAPTPCVTAQMLDGTRRVTSSGRALLLAGSQSICSPTGTPLILGEGQARVVGS